MAAGQARRQQLRLDVSGVVVAHRATLTPACHPRAPPEPLTTRRPRREAARGCAGRAATIGLACSRNEEAQDRRSVCAARRALARAPLGRRREPATNDCKQPQGAAYNEGGLHGGAERGRAERRASTSRAGRSADRRAHDFIGTGDPRDRLLSWRVLQHERNSRPPHPNAVKCTMEHRCGVGEAPLLLAWRSRIPLRAAPAQRPQPRFSRHANECELVWDQRITAGCRATPQEGWPPPPLLPPLCCRRLCCLCCIAFPTPERSAVKGRQRYMRP